ncbi:MAG: VWA domain-containing protein [Candidatus Sumerlaeales bacterium]|nr:VWA domain-containing protein [Candidatus Sumerlaeales bacterium]
MEILNSLLDRMNGLSLFHAYSNEFRLQSGVYLLLLLLVPIIAILCSYIKKKTAPTLVFPGTTILCKLGLQATNKRSFILNLCRYGAIILLIFAMSRPQYGNVERKTFSDGIDIMLVSDISFSMQANDFFPNRLEASKNVMEKFVDGRVGDRIGLTVFATEAAPIVPMTLDYNVVKSFIGKLNFNLVDGNSTAIGMGLATALKKILESDAKTKIVILLTDGENNAGDIDPLVAAEAAKSSGVRVYTIGIGSEGTMATPFGRQQLPGIDEESLSEIAKMTGGVYFRATDNFQLADVYKQIDKLEKSRVETLQIDNFNELAPYLILWALVLLLIEFTLKSLIWVRLP